MWIAPLNALFDSLCEGGPPRKADLIFVFAGRHERKRHGVRLWKEGFAPTLVLSVERFEWRRFVELGLPDDGGLLDLVERTPPVDRHFFVVLDRAGARAYRVPARGLGTWREAQALADLLGREGLRSVLVVSSAIHLKRAVSTLRGLARGVQFDATAVPDPGSVIARDGWWRLPRARRAVLREALKLFMYRVRLGVTAPQRREDSASRGPGA
jgi:uncharacterized SAM-binding protein YcdF (DUF218 family)